MKKDVRKELEVFHDLANLCASPGYAHAIAYFCFRDNTIRYGEEITVKDVLQQFSMDSLVRTEMSTLIGLACKKNLDIKLPSPDVVQRYIDETESLLKEIHHSMMPPMEDLFNPESMSGEGHKNPLSNGSLLREAIFYGGESAYQFQYRELSREKYKKDNDWFVKNKGFSISQVIDVVTSIQTLQTKKINEILASFRGKTPDEWSVLDAYKFTAEEICEISKIEIDIARRVINSFVSPVGMDGFSSLDDFNPKNAYPIISLDGGEYLLFQNYSLVEALYETPFFWFNEDKAYQPTAMRHRGEFTEEFSAERLKVVFGDARVFPNVDIYDKSKNKVGEIDVLVIFANRAIVLQAKSKKLTIASRKGNDNSLKDDFKKAVQDSYDQAFSCANFLLDPSFKLADKDGNEIAINRDLKEIYPVCVVSDHYPALSFQAHQFLKFRETENVKPPFVMDVFFLDVITEMLQSPLHFLSYICRRSGYGDRITATHELTVLSYHLKQNLWIDDQFGMIHLGDDISADLDLAMLVRREGIPGPDTVEGILTKHNGTILGQILDDIDSGENPSAIDLGFLLLMLSGNTIDMMNDGISQMISLGRRDGKPHDLTLMPDGTDCGITIHCSDDHEFLAKPRLGSHCERRKYAQRAKSWFGLCIGQAVPRIRFGVNLDFEWVQSDEMDEMVKGMPSAQNLRNKRRINFSTVVRKTEKVGRNDVCPCGSGEKYKKCCLGEA